jgi:hypothetical protein
MGPPLRPEGWLAQRPQGVRDVTATIFSRPVSGLHTNKFPRQLGVQKMSLVSTERSDFPRRVSGKCGFKQTFVKIVLV